MDDALALSVLYVFKVKGIAVLILVVMDDALALLDKFASEEYKES